MDKVSSTPEEVQTRPSEAHLRTVGRIMEMESAHTRAETRKRHQARETKAEHRPQAQMNT